jgi:hypothetical protein
MSEQVFKSPGFFEREIEIQSKPPKKEPNSSPVGIIGPAEKGPAFVPVILNSLDDYKQVFGDIQRDKLAGHAVSEFFTSKDPARTGGFEASVQFIRTLGLGSDAKEANGTSPAAGFVCDVDGNNAFGGVQLLAATHTIKSNEELASGMFSLNNSITATEPNLIRAMFFLHKDVKLTVSGAVANGEFTINVVVNNNTSIKNRSVTVSLDANQNNYIAKVLNTDPFAIDEYGYLLYLHFPIDKDLCEIKNTSTVSLLRGANVAATNKYGKFNSRFNSPKTSKFISQPFGNKEYDLFHFEAIDDGAYAAGKYKISISNLRASTDVNYKFGTFNIELRDLNDTDENPIVLESYANCSLDPTSSNYVAKLIGDQKTFYNIDVENTDERRLYTEGENPNQSARIRIIMSDDVRNNEIPDESLPFGFKGLPVLKTGDTLLDGNLNDAILPPLPYRFKITSGGRDYTNANEYLGQAGSQEAVSTGQYWGVMNFNIDSIDKPNTRGTSGEIINKIVENYCKFMGIAGSDVVYAENSTDADDFNNNKFTLARVALSFQYDTTPVADLSSSVATTFKEAIYVRNGDYNNSTYVIDTSAAETNDATDKTQRITMATILSENKEKFNKFSVVAKFTAPMFGGFDGLNIFDKDSMNMNDRASSTEDFSGEGGVAGKACAGGYVSALDATDGVTPMQGEGFANNIIASYTAALDQMLEPATATAHILVLPGIREPLICNYAARKVEEYGKAIYLMDLPHYSKDGIRLYDEKVDANKKPDVTNTIVKLSSRNFDNNYVASYFPDVMLEDASDPVVGAVVKRTLKCPSSIVALGALARSEGNSRSIQPWFAPAGFENGLNTRIKGVNVRLRADDRDDLYEARINPIATFPSNQYVIFGQKTLQVANTALNRVNVRRLMIEIKRGVERYAQRLLFEPNSAAVRNDFATKVNALLSGIQRNSGIENFRVVINDDPVEADQNILSGKIIVVPTRVVEFIAMDFIVTNSGVTFA